MEEKARIVRSQIVVSSCPKPNVYLYMLGIINEQIQFLHSWLCMFTGYEIVEFIIHMIAMNFLRQQIRWILRGNSRKHAYQIFPTYTNQSPPVPTFFPNVWKMPVRKKLLGGALYKKMYMSFTFDPWGRWPPSHRWSPPPSSPALLRALPTYQIPSWKDFLRPFLGISAANQHHFFFDKFV